MTTQLSAVFDDRDGADLALLRLRRNNIDYSIAELKAPERGSGPSFTAADIAGYELVSTAQQSMTIV